MVAGLPWWQWALSSVLVPLVIGLSAAYVGHSLSLRKARFELRIVERRTTYEELLPALTDLAAYDARFVRLAYHDFGGQAVEDRERAADDDWARRRRAAIAVIERVIVRGELGASRTVLDALETLLSDRARTRREFNSEELEYVDAVETDAASSKRALEAIHKAVSREA
jgi:hypothetical protein